MCLRLVTHARPPAPGCTRPSTCAWPHRPAAHACPPAPVRLRPAPCPSACPRSPAPVHPSPAPVPCSASRLPAFGLLARPPSGCAHPPSGWSAALSACPRPPVPAARARSAAVPRNSRSAPLNVDHASDLRERRRRRSRQHPFPGTRPEVAALFRKGVADVFPSRCQRAFLRAARLSASVCRSGAAHSRSALAPLTAEWSATNDRAASGSTGPPVPAFPPAETPTRLPVPPNRFPAGVGWKAPPDPSFRHPWKTRCALGDSTPHCCGRHTGATHSAQESGLPNAVGR